ncbi:MAG: transcriptional regulator [Gordonia sp.]|uniref:BTAD domain-containing putative transcriptional regulator n=1 Tax=Gordonia sp. (in: high G+C Gram-positive bacteria) TaxID=84139 RepID=UPI000C655D91|nr:BTAD domain-containing putative transcriptional regulator [Gordonia sp. (in: high G+C Gram-positive bacteria)]MAU80496.1 transcriptional regulator [Gordonia sp. (in: high G+C Gram-positive bacteria)]
MSDSEAPAPDAVTVIGLLGPVAVGVGARDPDTLVTVAGVRARRLLASLALADGRTRSAERLIDDVWTDAAPRSPMSALHTQISRLRPLLGIGRLQGGVNGYRLVDCRTDCDIVADLLDDPDSAALHAVARWWRGVPGDDLGDDAGSGLTAEIRRRADGLRSSLDQRRVARALAEGDFAVAREIADSRCRADPLDETAHVDLMRALAGQGRVAEALAVFTRLRRTLSQHLGVDPGPQAIALNTDLLATDQRSGDAAAPVPRSPSAPRRGHTVGLMVDASDLIGRDGDIREIVDLLGQHRLVTVQGPGGVGKTRVAHRVGADLADTGRPVFYVPLAPVRNDDDVVAAIAASLGVGETEIGSGARPRVTVGDLADRLVDAVRSQRAVIILDNCEQVVGKCARVVADLLAAEPQLSILTTSRSPLLLAAEQIYQLPVLDVGISGSAVELFRRRARAIRPDAQLPADEIAHLCRHLDGLPLAIELAAARIRTMTVAEISRRLGERFALLRGTDRTAPDRHRTLYAVIEWSWELLDPDAQTAMRRLCRFPAGFTAEAAGVVVGRSGVALDDTLEALVNQSLLNVTESDGQIRYRMLEMVREFGEEQLGRCADTDESEVVDRAMARWARQFADAAEARTRDAVDDRLLRWVAPDVENLVWVLRRSATAASATRDREAIDTVVSVFPVLSGFWMVRGLHGEVMSWGPRILAVLPTPSVDLSDSMRRRWQFTVLASMAHLLLRREYRSVATGRYYIRRLHRPDRIHDEPTELLSACALARHPLQAMRFVSRAARASNDQVRTAALSIRMNVRENFGNLDQALSDGLSLLVIGREHHNSWMSGMTQVTIASLYGQRGGWDRAIGYYRDGIADLARLGARDEEMQIRCYLVATLVALGRTDEAERELEIAGDGWRPEHPDPQGNPEVIGAMMLGYAELAFARGDHQVAGEIYCRAALLIKTNHPLGAQDPGMVLLLGTAVVGMVRAGDAAAAEEFVELLGDGINQMFGAAGWQDQPHAGVTAMAAGYLLCATGRAVPHGAWLLALAMRLGARQDYPSLYQVYSTMDVISGRTSGEWQALVARGRTLSRRQAVDEVRSILAPHRR